MAVFAQRYAPPKPDDRYSEHQMMCSASYQPNMDNDLSIPMHQIDYLFFFGATKILQIQLNIERILKYTEKNHESEWRLGFFLLCSSSLAKLQSLLCGQQIGVFVNYN